MSDGGISFLASCAVLAAIILLSLRHFSATGCAPGIGLLPLVALEDVDPRAGSGVAGLVSGEGCVRRAPEDALPTISGPPPRDEMAPVFLQRAALKDGPPGRGPVAWRTAASSRRASRPIVTFSEAVLFVSPTPGPRTARA